MDNDFSNVSHIGLSHALALVYGCGLTGETPCNTQSKP
jgi:hypothetical protein